MFEFRIRKEMTGDTALAIMNGALGANSGSMGTTGSPRVDHAPLFDGRATP